MAGHNRHLRGKTNAVKMPVHGNVTIEPGDLIMIGGITKTFCNSYVASADFYAYPLSSVTHLSVKSTVGAVRLWFMGVAMDGKPSGITRDISVAQTGTFRYPIYNNTAAVGTTVGTKVAAVTPGLATGGSNQYVSIMGHSGSTAFIGYSSVDQAGGASNVIVSIRGKYAPGGVVT